MAVPNPIAPSIFGVPASNLNGNSLNVVFSNVTLSIISPPPSNGDNLFSHSSFPYNMPMPVGANILCPEKQ